MLKRRYKNDKNSRIDFTHTKKSHIEKKIITYNYAHFYSNKFNSIQIKVFELEIKLHCKIKI